MQIFSTWIVRTYKLYFKNFLVCVSQMRNVLSQSKIDISERSKLSEIDLPSCALTFRESLPITSCPMKSNVTFCSYPVSSISVGSRLT